MARLVPAARQVTGLKPGSPEWLKTASASKVPAILGLSPWESPFSLWHRMSGSLPNDAPATDVQERGHYLEPVLRQRFADKHPDRKVRGATSFVNLERPWQTATPDGLVLNGRKVTALLECKTALLDWEWGEPGSDEVPPYYRAQAMWQMDCTGIEVVVFSVLTSHWDFREHIVRYDADEAEAIRFQVAAFMDSLDAGRAPSIDGHSETYRAIRELHPDIDNVDAEIDAETAVEFHNAAIAHDLAKTSLAAATTAVAAQMGSARRAVLTLPGGTVNILATRQTRAGCAPFVARHPSLTRTFTLIEKKAS